MADAWDAKYQIGGFRRRAEFIKKRMLPKDMGTGHWLDAGCGSGYFGRLLAMLRCKREPHTATGVQSEVRRSLGGTPATTRHHQ
jgi:hypothetical protein